MKRHLIAVLAFGLATASIGYANETAPHWLYSGEDGPEHWAELDKNFSACKLGSEQSPIDIKGATKAKAPAIEFSYHTVPLDIINNGHTVQLTIDKGNSITIGDKKYELLQTHFHTPSEERVDGKAYDMVWHLVHKSAEGKLAVVAVLVKAGADNATLKTIIDNLPKETAKKEQPAGVSISVDSLLPANRGYYHFMGSLTTPPCSEGVNWYVLKEPIEASPDQIKKFSSIFGVNARPTQPLNSRTIEESM